MNPDINYKTILIEIYEKLLNKLQASGWWPAETTLEIIIGAILTQNTAWTNVEKALCNLRNAGVLHDGNKLLTLTDNELSTLIKPAGFFNIKTKRLKAILQFFASSCSFSFEKLKDISLQHLRKKLLLVHGVGPETADSILLYALNKPSFVVDSYTKRILSRHKLIQPTASYEDIRSLFLENLPCHLQLFNEYHALIVRTCKHWCHKKTPLCSQCPLFELNDICLNC